MRTRALQSSLKALFCGRRGQTGESIVEVLTAMTIAALALIMLVMTISVATSIVQQGKSTAEAYYGASNALNEGSDPDDVPVNSGPSKVTITDDGLTDTPTNVDISFVEYGNAPGGGDVIAYQGSVPAEGVAP